MSSKSSNTNNTILRPQPTPEMQAVIETLCKNHGIDIYREFAGLKLENPPFMPLVIEQLTTTKHASGTTRGKISVAHYYYQEGDACAGPDIVFYFERNAQGATRWIPFEITQAALGQYFECYAWSSQEILPHRFVINRQHGMAEFSET